MIRFTDRAFRQLVGVLAFGVAFAQVAEAADGQRVINAVNARLRMGPEANAAINADCRSALNSSTLDARAARHGATFGRKTDVTGGYLQH